MGRGGLAGFLEALEDQAVLANRERDRRNKGQGHGEKQLTSLAILISGVGG